MSRWHWLSLPLEHRTGSDVFDALFRHAAIATLLESPYPQPPNRSELARYSICAGAPRIVEKRPQMWTPPVGQILPFLHRLLQSKAGGAGTTSGTQACRAEASYASLWQSQQDLPQNSLPFTGGWLGWLGYDLAWEIERLPSLKSDPLPFPVAFWYEPASFAVLDHWEQTLWLASSSEAELASLQQQLKQGREEQGESRRILTPATESLHFKSSQADYENAVRQAKKYIQSGDIFQANLSLRFEACTTADSWAIYRALQQINPSPFASYWQTPWGVVISCSPERLVQLQTPYCQTRPIAGTRKRGATPEEDLMLEQELIANTKERAEHVMLVDLERNDLGRVCEWGSVQVNELFTVERYSHVMHLVSNVTATLRHDKNAIDLIRATFPGGTITGCPKVRCMEIIEELEPLRRNLFYGSCGYLDWRGNLDLNILIRTLLYSPQLGFPSSDSSGASNTAIVWGQVGAGIVADSDPEKEWFESFHKAQAQLAALRVAY